MAASADDADNNIAIGKLAMGVGDVSGHSNIAIGNSTMDALTTGFCNVAIGVNAMGAATTGCQNVAIGDGAMGIGVTACGGSGEAEYNIGIGGNAAKALTTGSNNIIMGQAAGDAITTGKCNLAMGINALGAVNTGCNNIGIGSTTGIGITTGSGTINIGEAMNQTTAGVTCIGGSCIMGAIFTATSDCRSKKNIKDLSYGLNFINLLRPVSYKWKPQVDKLDKNGNLLEKGEGAHTHQRTMFGLLGQQVREVTKKLGLGYNDFAGYSDQEYENRNNPDWKKSYTMEDKTVHLAYDDFIAPLIKSVQELSAEVTELKAQLKTT
jgi:hypothetical protein